MAATGIQFNWSGVSHGTTTISKVTDVTFSQKVQVQKFHGDDAIWPQIVAVHSGDVTARVTSSDEYTIMNIAPGTIATFTASHKDAKHATNGDVVYTLVNAVANSSDVSGSYGQFGKATLNLDAFSSDGTTNPLSFARA